MNKVSTSIYVLESFDLWHGRLGHVNCETLEYSNSMKKGKIVISVKIRKFSRSRMKKRISPLESSCEI